MGLSISGISHTLTGLDALVAATAGFIRNGKIDPSRLTGKTYFYLTLVTSLTGLGLSKRGGLNPGHASALFIAAMTVAAYFLHCNRQADKRARLFENLLFTFRFLKTN